MADKLCSNCHQPYSEELSVCPHCHFEDVRDVTEDDIVDVLNVDEDNESIPADAVKLADGGDQPVEDVVEVIDENVPTPSGIETGEAALPFDENDRGAEESSADQPDVIAEVEDSGVPPSTEEGEAGRLDPKKTSLRKLAPETKLASDQEVQEALGEQEAKEGEPQQPADPKKTSLRKLAPETKLASDQDVQEMLGEQQAEADQDKPDDPKKTTLRPKIAPETKLAGGTPAPTMLAPGEEAMDIPDEEGAAKDRKVSEEDLLIDEKLLAEDASSVVLGGRSPDQPSGVDLIAEELESKSDLKQKAASDDDAVDLGSAASQEPMSLDLDEDDAIEVGAADLMDDDDAIEVGAGDLMSGSAVGRRDTAVEVDRSHLLAEGDEVETTTTKKKKVLAKKETTVVGKPKYARRWLGGTVVGLLLAALLAGGVWYLRPDLLMSIVRQHPDYAKTIKSPYPYPKVLEAREQMNKGQYASALSLLANESDREALATRGEARWLNYVAANQDALDPNDPEVQTALEELDSAKHAVLVDQIQKTLESKIHQEQIAQMEKDKAAVQQLLVDNKVLAQDDPQLATVAAGVVAAVKARDAAHTTIQNIAKALKDKQLIKEEPKPGEFPLAVLETQLDELTKAKAVVDKLETALQQKQEKLLETVTALQKERQLLETTRKEINAELAKAKVAMTDAKGVEQLAKLRDNLQNMVSSLEGTIDAVMTELNEGKPLKVAPEKRNEELTRLVKDLRDRTKSPLVTSVAEVVAALGALNEDTTQWFKDAVHRQAVEAQVRMYEMREPFIATPEQKVETWISLFKDRSHVDKTEMAVAVKDANWVLSPHAKTSDQQRAKAKYLIGMVYRNQEKFDEARTYLGDSVKSAEALKVEPKWAEEAAQALEELKDPDAYYVPLAQSYRQRGQLKEALQTVHTGLKAIPDAPQLRVLRGLIQLESTPTDKIDVDAIRADAEAGENHPDSAAKAYYLMGRLEETLGEYNEAEHYYREAIKNTPGDRPEDVHTYQKALGRLLLQVRNATPHSQPEGLAAEPNLIRARPLGLMLVAAFQNQEEPADLDETGELDAKEKERVADLISDARVRLKGEPKAKAQRVEKWIDLAEENLLQKPGFPIEVRGQGYMLLGRALSEVGKRTDGLKVYLQGLRLFMPNVETEQLDRLVESHPAFQVPDVLARPNPAKADEHFGQGVHYYWDGQYAQAVAEFERALGYHHDDARYHYYLGLALLGTMDKAKVEKAEFHFEQAARLEIQNQPTSDEVNHSLERVQGQLRQALNIYRRKAALEGGPQ